MAQFDLAYGRAMAAEGGYVDDIDDPGGATNKGVSLRWLLTLTDIQGGHEEGDVNGDGIIDIRDIKGMNDAEAMPLYKKNWWDKYQYGQLDPQALADKLFITAINMGAPPANRILQRALCAHGQIVEVDGVLGAKTFQAVRLVEAKESPQALLATYRADQAGYYRELVAHNPKFQKFLNGWLNRAYA